MPRPVQITLKRDEAYIPWYHPASCHPAGTLPVRNVHGRRPLLLFQRRSSGVKFDLRLNLRGFQPTAPSLCRKTLHYFAPSAPVFSVIKLFTRILRAELMLILPQESDLSSKTLANLKESAAPASFPKYRQNQKPARKNRNCSGQLQVEHLRMREIMVDFRPDKQQIHTEVQPQHYNYQRRKTAIYHRHISCIVQIN